MRCMAFLCPLALNCYAKSWPWRTLIVIHSKPVTSHFFPFAVSSQMIFFPSAPVNCHAGQVGLSSRTS